MGILADEAGNVRGSIFAFHDGRGLKQAVQLGKRCLFAAKKGYQAVHILRDQPQVLPGRSFGVVIGPVLRADGIERLRKAAVSLYPAEELKLRIPVFAIGVAALTVLGRYIAAAQEIGAIGQGTVGNGILHVKGHGFHQEVGGDVAVLHAKVLPAVRLGGRSGHGRYDFIVGEAGAETLYHGIGKHHKAGVAHHAVRLIAHEMPDGQVSLLLVNVVQGGHHVFHFLRMDKGHQGMRSAVSIPE